MLLLEKGYYNSEHHVVSLSGGKDSTAMLIRMIEEGWKINEVIFCDTGKEFKEMYDHLDKLEKYLGIKITRLSSKKSFEYYMFDHIKTKGKHKGKKGYGWPDQRNRWCTQLLKKSIVSKYLKQYYKAGIKVIEYHGIAADELERAEKNKEKNVRYPLIEWRMTEKECLEYCYERGFNWNGLYEKMKRVSCWCCPLQSLEELKVLYFNYPQLWERLKSMERKAFNKFRLDYTFGELEEKFNSEVEKE